MAPQSPPFDPAEHEPETLRGLVAEAFFIFGEEAARELACQFDLDFEDCGEAIERLRHPPH